MNIMMSRPVIGPQEIAAVMRVLKSGQITQGREVAALEEEFARYANARYAVALSSGTAAIHAGLHALGIGPGDEVITSPFTFVATANPVLLLGAKVVFADIDEHSFLIDTREVEKKISGKTKAIIPIDLFGQMGGWHKLPKRISLQKIHILEDACQAAGAMYGQKKAGMLGHIGVFSFYATKNMMCGEGGMAVTNSRVLAEKMRQFRHHGQDQQQRYIYRDVGLNYRMLDLTAAIARVQLRQLDTWNKRRQKNAQMLLTGLAGIPGLVMPSSLPHRTHVWHQFAIRVTESFSKTRDELMAALAKAGVASSIFYPKPLHMHPHFLAQGYKPGDFPVAERVSQEVLSLPVHPTLTSAQLKTIINAIKAIS